MKNPRGQNTCDIVDRGDSQMAPAPIFLHQNRIHPSAALPLPVIKPYSQQARSVIPIT
jgi:hypothetical protein